MRASAIVAIVLGGLAVLVIVVVAIVREAGTRSGDGSGC
jgi:hypothetical protein